MRVPAKEQLTVFVEGEELSGFIIYGLGSPGAIDRDVPPAIWEDLQLVGSHTLVGQHWEVVLWEVPLSQWPTGPEWQRTLSECLRAMIARGAKVAWVGAEGIPYADPPDLAVAVRVPA